MKSVLIDSYDKKFSLASVGPGFFYRDLPCFLFPYQFKKEFAL